MTRERIEELLYKVTAGLRSSKPSMVLPLIERAREAAEALGEADLRFEAERQAGWVRRLMGDNSQALTHFSAALSHAASAEPRLLFDTRLAWVVTARRVSGVPVERLLAVLDKAWTEAGDNDHHRALVLEERAGVLLDLGRNEEAWATVDTARPIVKRLSGHQRFFSLLHLAWVARKLSQHARAMEWLAEARGMPRATWGPSGEAAYLTHLGHVALGLGQKDAALATANALWSMAETLDRSVGIAAAGLLFEVGRASDLWEEAERGANRQLQLVREVGISARPLLSALLDQIEIDIHKHEISEAHLRLREAEQIAARLDNDTGTEIERGRVAKVRARVPRPG